MIWLRSLKALLPIKIALAVLIALLMMAIVVAILYATDLGFSVWDRLQQAPVWFFAVYLAILAIFAIAGAVIIWRVLAPRRTKIPAAPPLTEEALTARLQHSATAGVEVGAAQAEVIELARRRAAGDVYVAMFGDISTGKSSLIGALLPGAAVEASAAGGTTRAVRHYTWKTTAGDQLILADAPGRHEADASLLGEEARAEALRAHVIVYVCEGDLSRAQYEDVRELMALQRPLLVAVNKSDRYDEAERDLVKARLEERLGAHIEVVLVQSGGREEVTRVYADGREEIVERTRPPKVEALARALQRWVDADRGALERLRDSSVFVLTQDKLDQALAGHRRAKADAIVQNYARKAVFGALAAVGPGTDVLIQGYLGMNMIKELCTVYEAPVREMNLDRFLTLVAGVARRDLNLLLALAGNVLKAFPGIGTVVGGMLHAVAYGLIFESLGRAVAKSLESRGEWAEGPALRMFEDGLGENLEVRARRLAELVLAKREQTDA
ncbi:MAG: GTPase [Gammaproteobacteria bacterium]